MNSPTNDNVTDLKRPSLSIIEGGMNISTPEWYIINTTSGSTFTLSGFLFVYPMFIAIGDENLHAKLIVPMENLDFLAITEQPAVGLAGVVPEHIHDAEIVAYAPQDAKVQE